MGMQTNSFISKHSDVKFQENSVPAKICYMLDQCKQHFEKNSSFCERTKSLKDGKLSKKIKSNLPSGWSKITVFTQLKNRRKSINKKKTLQTFNLKLGFDL